MRRPSDPLEPAAPLEARQLRRLVEAMPKAELHLHLDGSVRIDTALELARTRGVDAPTTYAGMYRALVAPELTSSQAELLEWFELPIALLQDAEALERVAGELVEDKAADRVRYVEIRWGPALHTRGGLPLAEGIASVCRGAAEAADRTGVVVRLICTAIRSHPVELNAELADIATRFRVSGLVGFDLAGPEERYPDPLTFQTAFAAAREGGLRITVHAGEWGGAAQVRRALELSPERIAHGTGAGDDPALVAELVARGIALDLGLTSNVQAGIVRSVAAHPLARLHRAGVAVTLSVDDATVSDATLSEEYARAVELNGLSLPELWDIDRRALDVAFAEPDVRAALRAEFDSWGAGLPELAAPPVA
jgi:adenosine deaminase